MFTFFSRPTAVNLSDAAMKLKDIVTKAAATASETSSVFQVYYASLNYILVLYCLFYII